MKLVLQMNTCSSLFKLILEETRSNSDDTYGLGKKLNQFHNSGQAPMARTSLGFNKGAKRRN